MKEIIFNILREVLINELSDYFNITDPIIIQNFIEDVIIDIEDNLDD